jgi:hypothetical protein
MPAVRVSQKDTTADDCLQYAGSGTQRNLVADGPNGKPARRIVLLAASTTLTATGRKGVARVLTGLPSNYVHDCHTQLITSDAAFIAYW